MLEIAGSRAAAELAAVLFTTSTAIRMVSAVREEQTSIAGDGEMTEEVVGWLSAVVALTGAVLSLTML